MKHQTLNDFDTSPFPISLLQDIPGHCNIPWALNYKVLMPLLQKYKGNTGTQTHL